MLHGVNLKGLHFKAWFQTASLNLTSSNCFCTLVFFIALKKSFNSHKTFNVFFCLVWGALQAFPFVSFSDRFHLRGAPILIHPHALSFSLERGSFVVISHLQWPYLSCLQKSQWKFLFWSVEKEN